MTRLTAFAGVAWRTENLGALLFAARDRCVATKLAVLQKGGFATMTDAQLALFHNLDRSGARLTRIAALAGLTKSSVSELVDRAVVMGLVERVPDLKDGRAKRISYTPQGLAFLGLLDTAIAVADDGFTSAIGPPAMRRTLAALVSYAEPATMAPRDNIGRLLGRAAKRFVAEVLAGGPDNIGEPLLTLIRTLDIAGSRLTDLAARGGVTKQAMRETVALAVRRGFVETRSDPDDRRARCLAFTPTGLDVLDRLRISVADAERDCRLLLGDTALADLRCQLKSFLAADQAKLRPTNQ